MIKYLIKRDGERETWNSSKLFSAVVSAATDANEVINRKALDAILSDIIVYAKDKEEIDVADVHRIVEFSLLKDDYVATAQRYNEWRRIKDAKRIRQTDLFKQIKGLVDGTDKEVMRLNANKQTDNVAMHRDAIAGVASKDIGLYELFSDKAIQHHREGKVYIHDLDYCLSPMHNCGVYDYEALLDGFKMNYIDIDSPKSITVAATVLSQIASMISSASYGGQSIYNYNLLMAKYAKITHENLIKEAAEFGNSDSWVDYRLKKEIHNANQTFIYQINTICGSNGQSAFCTISLVPSEDPYAQMVTKDYLEQHKGGLGKKRVTPLFPKVIYAVKRGVNLDVGDPHYDELKLAMECSTEQMYPDYIFVDNNIKMTGFTHYQVCMGCRSNTPVMIEDGKEKHTGRFNLGVVSVNVPLAFLQAKAEYKETHKSFYDVLDEYCETAFEAHMARVNKLAKTKAEVNPIMWMEGAIAKLGPKEDIGKLFYDKRATVSLGYMGISDALELMGRKEDRELALRIVSFLDNKTKEFTKRTGIYFSLYGTPAESLCYTFAEALKRYDKESKRDYLTNSFHLPVYSDKTLLEKFEYEKDFFLLSAGGNVNTVELPNMRNNVEGFHSILKAAYDRVAYFIPNTPVDKCFSCGNQGEFDCDKDGYHCPVCGCSDKDMIDVKRRVSGYLGDPPRRPFNKGKQHEVMERVKNCSIQR